MACDHVAGNSSLKIERSRRIRMFCGAEDIQPNPAAFPISVSGRRC